MLEGDFTFSTSNPQAVLAAVSEMTGVRPALSDSGPYRLHIRIYRPFGPDRMTNVANVVRGLAPDAHPAPSGQE